jgi:hypothetical protein
MRKEGAGSFLTSGMGVQLMIQRGEIEIRLQKE